MEGVNSYKRHSSILFKLVVMLQHRSVVCLRVLVSCSRLLLSLSSCRESERRNLHSLNISSNYEILYLYLVRVYK